MREFKIRASACGQIMTEPRTKSETLSETCKTYLREWWVAEKYGRVKEIDNKYIQKGNGVEEDSITLLSVRDQVIYIKNETNFTNDHMMGTPDLIIGKHVIDIKSSWDIFTFHKAKFADELDKGYWWQVQVYMALTGATSASVTYCLVDTPRNLIDAAKQRFAYQYGDSIDLTEGLEQIERNMTFSDIAATERIKTFRVERDDAAIERIKVRVEECREYLNSLSADEKVAATEAKDKRKEELTTGA